MTRTEMTTALTMRAHAIAMSVGINVVHQVGRFPKRFACAMAIRKQRRALARLDDRLLKDIGVSRAEADTEAARAFMDLPRDTDATRAPRSRYRSVSFARAD